VEAIEGVRYRHQRISCCVWACGGGKIIVAAGRNPPRETTDTLRFQTLQFKRSGLIGKRLEGSVLFVSTQGAPTLYVSESPHGLKPVLRLPAGIRKGITRFGPLAGLGLSPFLLWPCAEPALRTRRALSSGGCDARFVGRLRGASVLPLDA
jgi:hypothetical protein